MVKYGQLLWMERVEKTAYSYNGQPYADTVTVITPESEYRGGSYCKMKEVVKTTTTYADGSKRESEIVALWQRDEAGVITGQSASGTVTGTEIVGGKPVPYTGSITLSYSFSGIIGWYKTGYSEKRTSATSLPKRLPFEVAFVDDPHFRAVF
jgi:hypothetical protein